MFSLREEKKAVKIILTIVCVVFLAVCIFAIFKYGNDTLLGNINEPDNDDVKFIRSAWTLAETGVYVYHRTPDPTVFMMPGLSYTLSFFVILFGKFGALTAFRIVQAVLQTLSLLLIFFIGRRIFNSKVGVCAVIVNAVYFVDVWVTNLILTETFFKFLLLNLVYFSIYAVQENKTKYFVGGALFWGLATLFRPTIATYPIVLGIILLLRRRPLKEILKHGAIAGAIFCLILSPWWVRNYQIFNRFIPLTLASGNPMLQGTYIDYDQSTMETDGLDYGQFVYPAESEIATDKVEREISIYRLKNLVPKDPLNYIKWYTFDKAFKQINWPFYWIPILGVEIFPIVILHYIILVSGLLGIIVYYRNKQRDKAGGLVFGSIIYFVLAYLPFYAFARYFYPVMPLVIIFACSLFVNQFNKQSRLKQGI